MKQGLTDEPETAPLLAVEDLCVEFPGPRRGPAIRAVDGVGFGIRVGETLGMVGESGSGKTTTGRAILGLAPVSRGKVVFDGREITRADRTARRDLTQHLQVVFQDPYSSMNPTRTAGQTLAEAVRSQRRPAAEVTERVGTMLERVGLSSDAANRYPSQFSGGQRQRIAITRALMVEPRLVICDEPVSALDLSVQAQVLNLLRELQTELGLSYMFISHDLAVVRHVAHRIVVLYRGRVMEQGEARVVSERPAHPYTRALLQAVLVPDPALQRRRRRVASEPPDARSEVGADACPFAPRCPNAIEICRSARPAFETTPDGTSVACHRWRELRDQAGDASGAPAPLQAQGRS